MGRRSNFNDTPAESHRASNFERRLRTTDNSELEPEMVTPQTAGAEELPEYEEVFPLTEQFRQRNFRGAPGHGRTGSDDQRQARGRRPRTRKTEERVSDELG